MGHESPNGQGPPLEPEATEAWLRRRMEPEPEQVERLVRRALEEGTAGPAPARRPPWARPAMATALATLLLAFAVLLLRGKIRERPAGRLKVSASVTIPTLTNSSGRVELRVPPRWEPPKSKPVVVSKSRSGARIVGSGACVAMVLPEGPVRYKIIGGER